VRIGLASDSHGNVEALSRALDVFARAAVERVFFLGGRYADVEQAMAKRRGAARSQPAAEDDLAFLEAVRGALSREAGKGGDALDGKIVRVASRACPESERGAPLKTIEMLGAHICCLVHDKADLTREDISNATVLFHGNSAQPGLVQIGPRVFVTPGHLRARPPDGRPATFGLLEFSPSELELVVFDAGGAEVRRERAGVGGRGKMTVR
jgi:predicted phosphodiesterase